jgi:hypothetical protein
MRVLVACEESQEVCKAFRAKGHEAYSCDILDCSGGHPEWHIKDDVLKHLNNGWDLMIAHPPCTRLCNSGVVWLEKRNLWEELDYGANLFKALLNSNIPLIAVENPIPHKYALERIGRKYDQIIQPYMFGHAERKATCLWLKGLPLLQSTKDVKKEMDALPKHIAQRIHYIRPGKDRAMIRSKTFKGIAEAMAEQWGSIQKSVKEIRR